MIENNNLVPFQLPEMEPEKGNHKLDKFKDHLVQGKRLNARDQETFEKMKKAWSWANKMFSPQQVVQMLQNEYGHEKSHAYQILRDAYSLWGDAYDLDKRGLTKTLVEAAHVALSIGVREKDAEIILKAVKQLGELHKLNQVDNTIPPELAMPNGTRVYVINGDVHMPGSQPAGREVEDVEGEEVP
jgi:hypothetical protein